LLFIVVQLGRTLLLHDSYTMLPMCSSQYKKQGHIELLQQCCQPCGFPTNLGLFFCGFTVFFEDLRVACFALF